MSLPQSALRRPFTVIVAVVAITLASVLGWRQMPKDIFPTLNLPTIYVAQTYGGMDPAQMESYLVYFFEYHFLYLTGIEHVESKSIQGAALMKLQFHPGTDMSQAMSETVAYVNRARAFMPPNTIPPLITRFDAGSLPVGHLVFESETHSVTDMQDVALNRVRPLLATLPGVSSPPPFGGNARSIVVSLKPDRLKSLRMSPDEVVQAIAAANVVSPSGNLMKDGQYPMVPANSIAKNIEELKAAPIRGEGYPAVFVRDVAEVKDDSDIVTCYALVNGRRTVTVPIIKRANASTLAVANVVKENIQKFNAVLPPGMKVRYEFDRSPTVTRALAGVPWEGAIGALLTGLMVILFLRDWRSALVVVINIPLSLMAAVLALWLSGQTINIMTLGGLALAVGILVDEATVCLENIHVHRDRGSAAARAALDATNETNGPRLLAMLCILEMLSPALFMPEAAKAMFLPLASAVGFAMAFSYLLSSTLVPVLAVWTSRKCRAISQTAWFAKLQEQYDGLVQMLVNRRALVLLAYLFITMAVIFCLGGRLGTELFPQVASAELQIRLRATAGTDINGTEQILLRTLDITKAVIGPENVTLSLGFIGLHGSMYPINFLYLWNGGTEEAVLQIRLKSAGHTTKDLKERLRREFATQFPNVTFSFEPADLIAQAMSLGSPMPIEVAVSGPNLTNNRAFAEKIRTKLQELPVLRDVQFAQSLDYPTVEVKVDRERSGIIGPTMEHISHALVPATWSSRFEAPNFWADPESGIAYQVQVQIPQRVMTSLEDIGNLPVMELSNHQSVLLRNLATIREGTAMSQFDRYNMQRTLSVRANVAGADLGSAASAVTRAIKELGPPPAGVAVSMRGQVISLQEMREGLQRGLLVAIAAIFLLLMANFQSWKLPLVVVSALPAVLAGVVLTLWLTNTTLNVQSLTGIILAVGVAVANAILLVTFAERSRMLGATASEAAVEGARSRLRPILMTSAAMIAGMIPVAFGLSDSSGQMAPLARAIVGGLAAATVATLFVLPSAFALLQARTHRRGVALHPAETRLKNTFSAQ